MTPETIACGIFNQWNMSKQIVYGYFQRGYCKN